LLETTDRLILDVLRSATTTYGELCVMMTLTTETHESPAVCSASSTVYLYFTLLIKLFAVATDSQQSSPITGLIFFLSRVSTLKRDIDIANLSVRPSVRHVPVSDENGLTYRHSFFTIR